MEALVQAVEAYPEVMIYPRPRNEMEALVEAIEAHPEVLNHPHNKKTQTIEDVKNSWKLVAKELNARRIFKSVISGEDAKRKWTDLKYRTKKKAKAFKSIQTEEKTNEDPNAYLTLVEERVMDLLRSEKPIGVLTTSQISSVPSSHINAPTIAQNSSVSSSHINASAPSLHSVLPSGHVIIQAQSSPINSSLQSGHIIVQAPSQSTLPAGQILIQTSTPILPIPTSTSIMPDQFPKVPAHTPILTPDPNLQAPDPILTDVCTVRTAQIIKEEMFEIGEVETEPPLDDVMDEINNTSPEIVLSKNNEMSEINNTSTERVLCKNNHLYLNRRSRELTNKQKKQKRTEFDMLADIEERKMALLEEQIRIKRKHLTFQEKKTLIMEQQLAISKEQLAVSKEQLAVSKQILRFRIKQGS